MISSSHDIKGKLTIQKFDVKGTLVEQKVAHNSITTVGRQLVADLFKLNITGTTQEDKIKRITDIHLGRSNNNFDTKQTAMQDYVGKAQIQSVEDMITPDGRVMVRLVGELDVDNCNDALQEAGLFTDDEKPIMYNRVTFDTITKSKEFKLTLIWELTF